MDKSTKRMIVIFGVAIILMLIIFKVINYIDNNRKAEIKKEKQLKKEKSTALFQQANTLWTINEEGDKAIILLDSALEINYSNIEALKLKAQILFEEENYQDAEITYRKLENKDKDSESYALIMRGNCYLAVKKEETAVKHFFKAMKKGDKEAEELYNKYNPAKKVFSHYIVRCCDGSISSHSGQGACSHHGGVCKSREKVYKDVRKYTLH